MSDIDARMINIALETLTQLCNKWQYPNELKCVLVVTRTNKHESVVRVWFVIDDNSYFIWCELIVDFFWDAYNSLEVEEEEELLFF